MVFGSSPEIHLFFFVHEIFTFSTISSAKKDKVSWKINQLCNGNYHEITLTVVTCYNSNFLNTWTSFELHSIQCNMEATHNYELLFLLKQCKRQRWHVPQTPLKGRGQGKKRSFRKLGERWCEMKCLPWVKGCLVLSLASGYQNSIFHAFTLCSFIWRIVIYTGY